MLKTTIIESDKNQDYSELFSVISEIVGKAQFASILHLSPLVDAIKDLSASHRERKTCFNLICLLSHLVAQLKNEKFILNEENDQNGKQVKHMMSISRLLLLDGEEELGNSFDKKGLQNVVENTAKITFKICRTELTPFLGPNLCKIIWL